MLSEFNMVFKLGSGNIQSSDSHWLIISYNLYNCGFYMYNIHVNVRGTVRGLSKHDMDLLSSMSERYPEVLLGIIPALVIEYDIFTLTKGGGHAECHQNSSRVSDRFG